MDAVTREDRRHRAPAVDPVVTEIVRNGLIAATEEMKTNLMRTAYNMIIYEALDFTVGLFDAEGNTISIGLGLPMFIRGMSETVKAKIAHFKGDLDPGDILLTNDAYITGSHLNHMTFTVPIFHDGELVGFSCCMAHWPDVGGTLVGIDHGHLFRRAADADREDLPQGRDQRRTGVDHPDERAPRRARHGRFARAGRGGEDRREALSRDDAQVRPRRRARGHRRDHGPERAPCARARRGHPDGVYEAESFMDDDGISVGARVPIRVKVEVKGERMTVDLTEVSKQVRGFYNSGATAGLSCCQVAFKCLTSPLDMPINEGQFRALEVVLPPGRVVSAVKPAPMRWWMTYPMTVVDTIFKAMAPAMPERVTAGHHADLVVARVNGRRAGRQAFYIYLGGLIGGGWGAKHDEDGMSATIAINDGDTHNGPSEQVEAKYPLLVERYALRPDSGGAGRYRGGLGTEQVVQALNEIRFTSQIDRVALQAVGARRRHVRARQLGRAASLRGRDGNAISRTARRSTRCSSRATPTSCGRAAAAATARRWIATLRELAHDVRCGYVSRETAETALWRGFRRRRIHSARRDGAPPRRHAGERIAGGRAGDGNAVALSVPRPNSQRRNPLRPPSR